MNKVQECFLN